MDEELLSLFSSLYIAPILFFWSSDRCDRDAYWFFTKFGRFPIRNGANGKGEKPPQTTLLCAKSP